jgi:hypothetical protein
LPGFTGAGSVRGSTSGQRGQGESGDPNRHRHSTQTFVPKQLPPPNSDLYQLADVLTVEEKAIVQKVRTYMETKVQPIINKYWSDDAFPFEQKLAAKTERRIASLQATHEARFDCPAQRGCENREPGVQ